MKICLRILAVISLSASAVYAGDDFASKVDVSPLDTISLQHRQTIKTLDSFARQMIWIATGKSSLDGNAAVFTVLDMSIRPEKYVDRNIIKIKNAVLRQDFQQLDFLSTEERDRIAKDGTVSLRLLFNPKVIQLLDDLESQAVYKQRAVDEVREARGTMAALCQGFANFPPAAVIAPASDSDHLWKRLEEVAGNVPAYAEAIKAAGETVPAPVANYDNDRLSRVAQAIAEMATAWRNEDAPTVNAQAAKLAEILPAAAPAQYPSEMRRHVEVTYNHLAKLTLPASALYFFAFVCFLMSARSGVTSLRLWALRLFAVGLLIHTLGIGIRWWLVAGQHGSWFDGIPIKNQFESVLMSAWFGAVVGFILELRKSRGIFGAAASFVGWMSLTAIFAVPYVTNVEIGGEIGQVQGVLMSYWLYIHVTMVTASYALIGMGFLLSTWWLISYYRSYGTVGRLASHQISADVSDMDLLPTNVSGGGAIAVGFWQTLASLVFFPVRHGPGFSSVKTAKSRAAEALGRDAQATRFLARLDACNLVVLQLAFWVLGTGVVLGAIWADQSWGRPWGWDPKETFALVTWIVYLVVVHVRVATEHKAWWTAVLSIIGFFVMLFNWVGVNFFLSGLHSYA